MAYCTVGGMSCTRLMPFYFTVGCSPVRPVATSQGTGPEGSVFRVLAFRRRKVAVIWPGSRGGSCLMECRHGPMKYVRLVSRLTLLSVCHLLSPWRLLLLSLLRLRVSVLCVLAFVLVGVCLNVMLLSSPPPYCHCFAFWPADSCTHGGASPLPAPLSYGLQGCRRLSG